MTLATVNPNPSTIRTPQHRTWASGVMTTSRPASRVFVVAALLALPLVSAAAATAAPEPTNTSKAHIEHREWEQGVLDGQRDAQAAQLQSYLDGLKRAAQDGAAAEPAGRSAFAAPQRSYVEHLAQAARESRSDTLGDQSASSAFPRDTGHDVPVPVAALLALGGMALGTGVTVASRRLPLPHNRRLAV